MTVKLNHQMFNPIKFIAIGLSLLIGASGCIPDGCASGCIPDGCAEARKIKDRLEELGYPTSKDEKKNSIPLSEMPQGIVWDAANNIADSTCNDPSVPNYIEIEGRIILVGLVMHEVFKESKYSQEMNQFVDSFEHSTDGRSQFINLYLIPAMSNKCKSKALIIQQSKAQGTLNECIPEWRSRYGDQGN
jgi:hypothetical protein